MEEIRITIRNFTDVFTKLLRKEIRMKLILFKCLLAVKEMYDFTIMSLYKKISAL